MSKGSKSHSPSSGHRSQASSSSLNAVYSALDPAVKRNGSLRDVPVEQDEDARSVETKTARSAAAVSNNNQRRQTNGSTTSTSESSSANSGSNDSVYANEAFKYSGGIDEEIAQYAAASEYALSGDSGYQASNDEGEPNAVRVADEGKGTVVEANGRPLSTLQDDVVTGE